MTRPAPIPLAFLAGFALAAMLAHVMPACPPRAAPAPLGEACYTDAECEAQHGGGADLSGLPPAAWDI